MSPFAVPPQKAIAAPAADRFTGILEFLVVEKMLDAAPRGWQSNSVSTTGDEALQRLVVRGEGGLRLAVSPRPQSTGFARLDCAGVGVL